MSEQTHILSAIEQAVSLESANWKEVKSIYPIVAQDIASHYATGNQAGIHIYMIRAQDKAENGSVWKRVIEGTKSAMKRLDSPLQFTGTRDYRETHRKRAPLFVVDTIANVKKEKQAEQAEQAEQAAKIEQAEKTQAEQAARELDAAVTPSDLAETVIEEIDRLELQPVAVLEALYEVLYRRDSGTAGRSAAHMATTFSKRAHDKTMKKAA